MDLNDFSIFNKTFLKSIYSKFGFFKRRYSITTLFYILNKGNHQKKLPFLSVDSFYESDTISDKFIINNSWKYNQLKSTLQILKEKQNENSNLTDIITFSIVPSLFLFFIDEQTFDSFIDFINELSPENDQAGFNLQALLSRSLFVSPLFTRFTHQVFYHLLQTFPYNEITTFQERDSYFIEKAKKSILDQIKSNLNIFPSYISIFFQKFNNKARIKELFRLSFIEPFIQNPALFIAVDPWIFDIKPKNDMISHFLKIILTDIADEILEMINSNGNFFDSFAFHQEPSICRQIVTFGSVFNNIDLTTFQYIESPGKPSDIYDFINDKSLDSYTLYYGQFTEDHLLVDEGEIDKIKGTLNAHFSPFQYYFFKIDDEFYLLNSLLTKEVKAIKQSDTEEGQNEGENEEIKIPVKGHLLAQKPYIYLAELKEYSSLCSKGSKAFVGSQNCNLIFAHRYLQNFTFNNYLTERKDLSCYDMIISDFLTNDFGNILQMMKSGEGFSKEVLNLLNDRASFFKHSNQLRDIFSDSSDPYAKISHINQLILSILTSNNKQGGFTMVESENMIPTYLLLLLFANPPHLVSNIVYFLEFFDDKMYNSGDPSISCFMYIHGSSQYFMDLLKRSLDGGSVNLEGLKRTEDGSAPPSSRPLSKFIRTLFKIHDK